MFSSRDQLKALIEPPHDQAAVVLATEIVARKNPQVIHCLAAIAALITAELDGVRDPEVRAVLSRLYRDTAARAAWREPAWVRYHVEDSSVHYVHHLRVRFPCRVLCVLGCWSAIDTKTDPTTGQKFFALLGFYNSVQEVLDKHLDQGLVF